MTVTHDPQQLREVLGHYPTGVAVVTGIGAGDEPLAMVVGTFSSVSLDPPLVCFLPMKSSSTYTRLAECETLCINVLTADQEALCREIARRRENKLADTDWRPAPGGAPILEGTLAWIQVRIVQQIDAGDHWITLCSVDEMAVENADAPLLFFQGGYGSFVVPSLVARLESRDGGAREGTLARPLLERLTERLDAECTLHKVLDTHELVAVARATPPDRMADFSLGMHLPLVPPIGDAWAASASEEEAEAWLRRAVGASEEQLDIFRDRLDFYRRNGYLLTFLQPDDAEPFSALREVTTQYADLKLTPAAERYVRQRITEASPSSSYDMRRLEARDGVDVGSIMVAIPDASGSSTFILRVSSLPRSVSGSRVQEWVREVRQAASNLAEQFTTNNPSTTKETK